MGTEHPEMTETKQGAPFEPIAVVGMACLYPESISLEHFWKNILSKRDLLSEIPRTHWLLEDFYDADPKAPEKTYSKRGGILPEVPFDYLAFGIPPNVLSSTDASQLLGLLVAKALFENAFGEEFSKVDRERVSVVLGFSLATSMMTEIAGTQHLPIWIHAMRECGISEQQIKQICERRAHYSTPWTENSFPGLLQNVIAGRIANRFDLHGPNCSIDAACASSLAAIDLAIKQLHAREVDVAVTGGAQTASSPLMYMCFSKTPALSPRNLCSPFDEASDGTMIGEGVGMLALKRLTDAERDGDHIYAVIRGVGASSDGKGKSIYAPESEGQMRALRRAYEQAGYAPETVELVEAHGTGTKAGDAAELKTLVQTFQKGGRADRQWCALGSVKSQIGHTAGAAGAASLIKTILALHHKVLPPTANIQEPTRQLDFKSSPFYLNTEARPWIHVAEYPRRAAVSSFGFGGTNYHVALEEYTDAAKRPRRLDSLPTELFVFSAQDAAELAKQLGAFQGLLATEKSLFGLAKLTRGGFDPSLPQRLALVAVDKPELGRKLEIILTNLESAPERLWLPPQGILYKPQFAPRSIAFLFPGQGSQYLQMGAELAKHFDVAREIWDAGDREKIDPKQRLSQVVFPIPSFSEAEQNAALDRLTATEWAQPSLGITSAALLAVLDRFGLIPDMVAGHSFGEETALYFAGCYDLANFLKIARRRGELMSQASEIKGGMLAVAAPLNKVEALLQEWNSNLIIANYNSPKQAVLSGELEDIATIKAKFEALGIKATPLRVATAFHSSIVSGSSEAFYEFLKRVELQTPRVPVYSNLTGALYPQHPEEIRQTMARHLACPVRFVEQIENMHQAGANVFVEVGPGSTLSRLVDECLEGRDHLVIPLDIKGKDGLVALMEGVARLSAIGIPLNLDVLDQRDLAEEEPAAKTATTLWISSANYQKNYPPKVAAGSEAQISAQAVGSDLQPSQPAPAMPSPEVRVMPRAPQLRRANPNLTPETPAAAVKAPPPPPSAPAIPVGLDLATLKNLLLQVVAEKTGYPLEMLNLEMNLEADLGIDSIKRVEILSALKEREPHLPEVKADRLAELQTLGQIIDFMRQTAGTLAAPVSAAPVPVSAELAPVARPVPGIGRYGLRLIPAAGHSNVMLAPNAEVVICADDQGVGEELLKLFLEGGFPARLVTQEQDLEKIPSVGALIYLGGLKAVANFYSGSKINKEAFRLAKKVAASLQEAARRGGAWFVTVQDTGAAFGLTQGDSLQAIRGGLAGLSKTLKVEWPGVMVKAIDIKTQGIPPAIVAGEILHEIFQGGADVEIALPMDGRRLTLELSPVAETVAVPLALNENSVLVASGGARGVTARCLVELAKKYRPKIVLFGRSPLLEVEPEIYRHLKTDAEIKQALYQQALSEGRTLKPAELETEARLIENSREARQTVQALQAAGSPVKYFPIDILETRLIRTEGPSWTWKAGALVRAAIAEVRREWGPITGLIHGAGVIADKRVEEKSQEQFDLVFDTKVSGLSELLSALDQDPLQLIVLFSSVAARFGNQGQSDYAMANEVMNKVAQAEHRKRGAACRVKSINWGAWDGGMVKPALREELKRRGVALIPLDTGALAFVRELEDPRDDLVEVVIGQPL